MKQLFLQKNQPHQARKLAVPAALDDVDEAAVPVSGPVVAVGVAGVATPAAIAVVHAAQKTVGHQVRGVRLVDADSVENSGRPAVVSPNPAAADVDDIIVVDDVVFDGVGRADDAQL